MSETCNEKRGSLVCEECDNWIIVKLLPKSQRYPVGFAVQGCKLDGAKPCKLDTVEAEG